MHNLSSFMVFERYLQLYDLRNFILANLFKFLLIPGAEFPSSSVRNNLLISDDIDGFHPWNRFQNRNIRLIWASLRFCAFRPKTMLMVWSGQNWVYTDWTRANGLIDWTAIWSRTMIKPVRHQHLSSIWPILDRSNLILGLLRQ